MKINTINTIKLKVSKGEKVLLSSAIIIAVIYYVGLAPLMSLLDYMLEANQLLSLIAFFCVSIIIVKILATFFKSLYQFLVKLLMWLRYAAITLSILIIVRFAIDYRLMTKLDSLVSKVRENRIIQSIKETINPNSIELETRDYEKNNDTYQYQPAKSETVEELELANELLRQKAQKEIQRLKDELAAITSQSEKEAIQEPLSWAIKAAEPKKNTMSWTIK